MITNLKEFIKGELIGWTKIDKLWLYLSTIIILGVSIYWKDSIIGILSALTGVWYTILTGKGKRSAFIFGLFNVLFYSYISYNAKYYGEVMLNMLYYLPMNFVGWFAWKKHMNKETGEVEKQHLSKKNSVIMYLLTVVGIFIYGYFLKLLKGNFPFVDSMSTVISVTAQVLAIKRLTEQWILWIIVNSVSVVMWGLEFSKGNENIATMLMWGIYLLNGIFMYFRWSKESKNKIV